MNLPPPVRDLVLIGGGHAHVQVLRDLALRPLPGVRTTLVTREVESPYSGMLPGHIAGFYSHADMHIDLLPLCRAANVRLIIGEVTGLDPDVKEVNVESRPPLRFDWLAINAGAVPQTRSEGVPVKPIGQFLPQWDRAKAALAPGAHIIVVGAGAGGVELAFAMHAARPDLEISLVGRAVLPGFSASTNKRLISAASERGVRLVIGAEALRFTNGQLHLDDGRTLAADEVFWVTDVCAPAWMRASGLATDPGGFIRVQHTLQSISNPAVFAAGDVACLEGQERPKSGLFAVRAGPVLSHNLRAVTMGQPLKSFRAQQSFLRLIGTADGSAIAEKWGLSVSGQLMWIWKDQIDRRFMSMFRMAQMPSAMQVPAPVALPQSMQADVPETMRCGGCGAKLGADLLGRVLRNLPIRPHGNVLRGIGDDAAEVNADGSVLITTDGLRTMVDDPYRFGRIVTHHNLNDLFAMGATPTSAVALVTVPLMSEALMEAELTAVLRGAVDVLEDHDVPLVGGHSAEGAELFLGLTVTGRRGAVTLTKGGLAAGQKLVLTRGVGTGAILAAAMRGLPVAAALETAIRSMDSSNQGCAEILVAHGARAATDVTGFGLLGHLAEMLRASGTGAVVDAQVIPVMPGAADLIRQGVQSSLQKNNEQVLRDFSIDSDIDLRVLCDPQTSGGLLAGVPAAAAEACLDALHAAGHPQAAIIGEVTETEWRIR
ncbi:MAG: selenide, water dikinase SelD [Gammaproteobacteria bacterium]|nr:selenide, water dikinase SelD [Gammaproteobacteria bacterium]